MNKKAQVKAFLDHNGAGIMPQLSIDCVVFGFHDRQLKVLLTKLSHSDYWLLPGGFIGQTETLDEAAHRILSDRTGLHDIYLEQFRAFGSLKRADSRIHEQTLAAHGIEVTPDHWLLQRFISIGYFALVDFLEVIPEVDALSDACEWFELNSLPMLGFDHREIIDEALEALRRQLDYKLAVFNLLPEKFTMGDLQALYETILGAPLRRNNFQRKMLSLDIFERVEKKFSGGAHKAPFLYRFKEKR